MIVPPPVVEGHSLVDEAGCAEPALQGIAGHEAALHGMQFRCGVSFDRDDVSPIEVVGRQQAAGHRRPVDEHRAGSADACAAHQLRARQPGNIADDLDGGVAGHWLELKGTTVDMGLHVCRPIER